MVDTTSLSVLVLYHFFHPDDVVSAQHYADLCEGLHKRGWRVTVLPCSRSCRTEKQRYPRREIWKGVDIRRIWRPGLRQASIPGRLLNSAWMLLAWTFAAFRHNPDVLVVGTDPIFGVLAAIPWRVLRPRTRIFHWCFDLHPEAAVADGMIGPQHIAVRLLRAPLRWAYRSCDLIGSLGPCMTRRLEAHRPLCPIEIITPWALSEPDVPLRVDPEERKALFGAARVGLMYSGNLGLAHDGTIFLALARKLRDHPEIQFIFSVRGNQVDAFRKMITPLDTNIGFVDFATQDRLEARISAADIHLVSLMPDYSGTVVPSKFQGALAAGRPVLYAGPSDSAISHWINTYKIGWNISMNNIDDISKSILLLASSQDHAADLNKKCHAAYIEHFSKSTMIDRIHHSLKKLCFAQFV